jgi:hypothetical protein
MTPQHNFHFFHLFLICSLKPPDGRRWHSCKLRLYNYFPHDVYSIIQCHIGVRCYDMSAQSPPAHALPFFSSTMAMRTALILSKCLVAEDDEGRDPNVYNEGVDEDDAFLTLIKVSGSKHRGSQRMSLRLPPSPNVPLTSHPV